MNHMDHAAAGFIPIFVGLFFIALAFALYFVPGIIAYKRNHNNLIAIVIINIFLGWTVLGWLGALIWSVSNPPPRPPNY
jgi:hypothetical protein